MTKKPAVFINTPMKVNNPEYEKLGIVPKEIELRDRIGIQLMPEALAGAARAIESLLERQEEYAEKYPPYWTRRLPLSAGAARQADNIL